MARSLISRSQPKTLAFWVRFGNRKMYIRGENGQDSSQKHFCPGEVAFTSQVVWFHGGGGLLYEMLFWLLKIATRM